MQPIAESPSVVELRVTGPLDVAAVTEVGARLADGLARSPDRLVVDLTACTFVDAAGIGLLVDAHRRLRATGGRLTLRGTPPRIARTLTLARVERVLARESDDDAA